MKTKLICLFFFACLTLSVLADDVIITVDAERIDAIISEISDTEVKFKRKSNPDGPLVVMSTEKIATIIYSNGTVQAFDKKTPQTTHRGNNQTASYEITKMGSNTYRYGSKVLDKYQYEQLLRNTCPNAYKLHHDGKLMMIIGPSVGAGLMAIGAITMGVTLSGNSNSIAGPIIGGILITTSAYGGIIGVTVAGAVKKNKALRMYNTQCASTATNSPDLKWSLTTGVNGIGIALNF